MNAKPQAEKQTASDEDTRDHPDATRIQLAIVRQPADEDGNKDHVIDAQHHFHQGQRQQRAKSSSAENRHLRVNAHA